MKKLVLKTMAITLAAVVGVFAVAFGAACIFAPKFLADCFDGVGAYSASVFFYEKQYEKSKKVEDLALLVDKIDGEKESEKAEKYLALLIGDEWFDNYCQLQDVSGALITTKEYYSGLYAVTLIDNGKIEKGLEFCYSYVEENGYGKSNPYRIVVSEFKGDKDILAEVKKSLLNGLETLQFTSAQAELITADINELTVILK